MELVAALLLFAGIEQVKASSVTQRWQDVPCSVDYSRLSQPLLAQVATLLGKVLKKFVHINGVTPPTNAHSSVSGSCNGTANSSPRSTLPSFLSAEASQGEPDDDECLFIRLAHLVAAVLSTVLQQQPDLIIDAAYDADVMQPIFQVAALPSGLESFLSQQTLMSRWLSTQSRALELVQVANDKDGGITPPSHRAVMQQPGEEAAFSQW